LQVSNIVEAASKGPTAVTLVIWIAAVLGAIAVSYGALSAANGISGVLNEKWPKKDFIPYSERRR
jgi:hypothetical protein